MATTMSASNAPKLSCATNCGWSRDQRPPTPANAAVAPAATAGMMPPTMIVERRLRGRGQVRREDLAPGEGAPRA
jgi:hypothetical protein